MRNPASFASKPQINSPRSVRGRAARHRRNHRFPAQPQLAICAAWRIIVLIPMPFVALLVHLLQASIQAARARSTTVLNVTTKNSKWREFMKMRMKHAIAIGAAIWSVAMTQAVARIDVQAGDWKLDFSGHANGFYVDAICDQGTHTAVNGGLACTGDNAASVRN